MNIIGFDPRGISRSGPTIACNYATVNGTLKRRQQDSTVVGDLKKRWDDNLEFNTACSDNNKDSDAKYAGTSAVVQDIMYFVEKQAVLRGEDSPETKHVNYFGTSYGTLIGETLVAMYPDRIRRALLDANVYGVAHYQGWEPSGPDDFAHGIWLFSKLCFEAGEEFCTLAEGTNSIDEVQALFDGAYNYLKESPIECGDDALTTIDSNSFISDIGQSMYNARNNYLRIMLRTVAIQTALKTGNTSDICTLTARLQKLSKRDDVPETEDAVLLVTAIDIAGRFPWKTYEEWKAAVERLDATKPYGGFDYGAGNGLLGLAMDNFIPPPSQYFTGFENGTIYETPFPVLFVNTPGDPVTPMSSAYQMSKLFSGSSVFIVNVPGHGYGNAPSNCTNDILAAYFADGVVPELGTTCEADVEANYYFGGPDQTAPETS
jgi:pimeloyl-ACP methyl ester carboxylesterase